MVNIWNNFPVVGFFLIDISSVGSFFFFFLGCVCVFVDAITQTFDRWWFVHFGITPIFHHQFNRIGYLSWLFFHPSAIVLVGSLPSILIDTIHSFSFAIDTIGFEPSFQFIFVQSFTPLIDFNLLFSYLVRWCCCCC